MLTWATWYVEEGDFHIGDPIDTYLVLSFSTVNSPTDANDAGCDGFASFQVPNLDLKFDLNAFFLEFILVHKIGK